MWDYFFGHICYYFLPSRYQILLLRQCLHPASSSNAKFLAKPETTPLAPLYPWAISHLSTHHAASSLSGPSLPGHHGHGRRREGVNAGWGWYGLRFPPDFGGATQRFRPGNGSTARWRKEKTHLRSPKGLRQTPLKHMGMSHQERGACEGAQTVVLVTILTCSLSIRRTHRAKRAS